MSKNVLVTGGAGYIGSHLCKALALKGYTPVTYDSLKTGHLSAVRFGPFVKGDILDGPLLLSTLRTYKPEAIFHLASYSNTRDSTTEAALYYKNNLIGTHTLLETLLSCPVPYFIFSSSASVYGKATDIPLSESSLLIPSSPYGRIKLSSELMIADFCESQSMHYANLRYFNASGADLDAEIGESHYPETHLIPLLIEALKEEKPFHLFESNHKTHDGTAKRDFVHVSDLAEGHIQALQFLKQNKKSITLNLGSGKGHTILDIITDLQTRTQKKIPIYKSSSLEEPACLIADITLAKELINWNPKYSTLDTIIETALRWHS